MPEDIQNPEQIILSTTGTPFSSEATARSSMAQKRLNQNLYRIVSHRQGNIDGYAIVLKPEVPKEKYYLVQFNEKATPWDTDDVILAVNGEILQIQRGVKVIIPERFKVCADHATYPHFTQMPNEPRKEVGTIKTYPYSEYGEVTEMEYKKMLAEGNKKAKEARARGDAHLIEGNA